MLGERLAELRVDRHMTQQELTTMLNLSKFTISSYENNTAMPNDEIKIKIARIFDVYLDYLLGLIDVPLSFSTKNQNCIFYPANLSLESKKDLETCIEFIKFKYANKLADNK